MRILKLTLIAIIAFLPVVYGQLSLGRIEGSVTDPAAAMVGGAKIEARNVETNLRVSAESQSNGLYQINNLPIGNYAVTVTREGFEKQVFTAILVQGNRTTTVNAQLKVGQVSTSVEVTGTPLRNETDPTVGYVLDASTIQNTPLGTGSFTQLAILSPGVSADFLAGSGTNTGLGNQNIWSNGQRDTSNSFPINAISANNLFNGKSSSQVSESRYILNTGYGSLSHAGGDQLTSVSVYTAIGHGIPTPAAESLQEMRVNAAQFDATQGGTSGAQIALITRSGTNQFHGQLYDYFQNKNLNAAPFFRNADAVIPLKDKRPALHYNRFGATLGGPIFKDKAFFFVSYQGLRDSDNASSSSNSIVPQHLTDDRSQTALANVDLLDFGKTIAPSAVDPVAFKILNYKVGGQYLIPSATVTDPAAAKALGYNALVNGVPTIFRGDQANGNIDWDFGPRDRLAEKFFISKNPNQAPFAQASVVGFGQALDAGSWLVTLDNTYVVKPSLTWEQRVGVIRQRTLAHTDQALTPNDVGMNIFGSNRFPAFQIFTADNVLKQALYIGPRSNFGNAGAAQNRASWASTANWVKGRHTLSFGFDMNYTQLNIINEANQVSTLESNTFADFLAGFPLQTTFSYFFNGASNRYYRAWQAGVFAQDNYKLKSNFNISLGLRYDYNGPFSEKYGNLANFHADAYKYDAATGTVTNSGIVIAGNNATLGTKGVSDSTMTGRQWGVGPRIGFAWSPGFVKNLTIRGGAGLYFDRGEFFTYLSPGSGRGFSGPFGVTLQLPFVAQVAATSCAALPCTAGTLEVPFGTTPPPAPSNPNAITALLPTLAGIKTGATPYLFGGYDSTNVLPYTENWSLDLQYQAANSWLFSLGYVGNHGVHQVLPIPFNQPGIATASNPINGETTSYGFNQISTENIKTFEGGNTDLRVPYLGYSSNNVLYKTIGTSTYNALQFGVRKRLSRGLQMTASYTWSHTLDDQSGLGLFYNGNDPTNTHLSYGTSSYDRTHVFIVSYLYELPQFSKNSRALGEVVNGWQLNGLVNAQSGQPFNLYDFSGAVAGEFYGKTLSIVDPIVGFTPGLTNQQIQLQGTTGVNPSLPYIDATKLYIPTLAPGTNGVPACTAAGACDTAETSFSYAGRNTFRGPFQSRMDLSVAKNFRISERYSLRYSAEFYNLGNHPSFDAPNNSTSLYSVNSSTNVATARGPSATTGYITHTIGSPRFAQMTLRLTF